MILVLIIKRVGGDANGIKANWFFGRSAMEYRTYSPEGA
jgi:hypothetical protein